MSETSTLIAFLRARYGEEEMWAHEASRDGDRYTPAGEHWRWECEATGTPIRIDPVLDAYVQGVDRSSVGLRSVEEYPTTWGATIPHLVIRGQAETSSAAAFHIAHHDTAHVLADVAAKRRIVDDCAEHGDVSMSGRTLFALAAAYAQHPDYQQTWEADLDPD